MQSHSLSETFSSSSSSSMSSSVSSLSSSSSSSSSSCSSTPSSPSSCLDGADLPCVSMVKYHRKDGSINENEAARKYLTVVGSTSSKNPLTHVTVHHRTRNLKHSDEIMLTKQSLAAQIRKSALFVSNVLTKKDRKIEKKRMAEFPPEMHAALSSRMEKPIILVDIDGTIKKFEGLFLGGPAMEGASIYLNHKAETHNIVYLTSRGNALGGLTRDWLHRNEFPSGPLFISEKDVGYAIKSMQQKYKTRMVAFICEYFKAPIVECYGDQQSDMNAYKTIQNQPKIYMVNFEKDPKFWVNHHRVVSDAGVADVAEVVV